MGLKCIIAGSRDITDYDLICQAIQTFGLKITEVVCGMARGVDLLGKRWADENKVPVKEFPADWNKYGRSAGMIRNEEMATYADALILVWDGKSRGSKNMLKMAKKYDLNILEIKPSN